MSSAMQCLLLLFMVIASSCIQLTIADDTSTCEQPEITVDDENNNMTSKWEFMSAFSKLGTSWNHVIGECEYLTDV